MTFRDFLSNLPAFIVALGVLIAVHEYGHFAIGRALGFKVLRFSIGFGRPLLLRRGRDGTEYVLAMIPLGGFVRFADEAEAPVAAADRGAAFNHRPVWARILVLLAGPGANFVFAILAFWVLFQVGVPGLKPVVGDVLVDSLAARAGLRSGDEIVAVNGRPAATQESAVLGVLSAVIDSGTVRLTVRNPAGERPVSIAVPEAERSGLTEPGAWSRGLGFAFVPPRMPAQIGALVAGGTAGAAGLRAGDRIENVDGQPIKDFTGLVEVVSQRPGKTVPMAVRRGGELLTFDVPVRAEPDPLHAGGTVGRIGIRPGGEAQWPPGVETVERYGVVRALPAALGETWDKVALTAKFLAHMVTGQVSRSNISGPLQIAQFAGITARAGGTAFLSFLALISISLGVLNLLPIPILDGGQIVYQCAEGLRGRPLSDSVKLMGQNLGFAMLILLMSLAFYNDLRHLG